MNVTRQHLELAIARVKRVATFRFDQAELNERGGELDVFPEIPYRDISLFTPKDFGCNGQAFFMWTKRAARAFDADGALAHAFPIHWAARNFSSPLQMAFARQGLVTRMESGKYEWEGFYRSGTLVLSPHSASARCDLIDLIAAFDDLQSRGVVALANAGQAQSGGWEDVNEKSNGRRDNTAVFWHDQSHEAFDGLGQLRPSGMSLYWRGNEQLIAEGLRAKGFVVELPSNPDQAIRVLPSPTSVAPTIETFAAAMKALPAMAKEASTKSRKPSS